MPEQTQPTWQKTFLDAGTKEIGKDLSAMIGIVSEIIATERLKLIEGAKKKFTNYLKNLDSLPWEDDLPEIVDDLFSPPSKEGTV